MIGILYLFIAWLFGYQILKPLLPNLVPSRIWMTGGEEAPPVSLPLIMIPGSFLVGTLLVTWITYLAAYLFRTTAVPLWYGNAVSLGCAAAVSAVLFFRNGFWKTNKLRPNVNGMVTIWREARRRHKLTAIIIIVVLTASVFLMFYTFRIEGGVMRIGFSVWSDFGPHLAAIRSFSHGFNFPTEYPHFPNGEARYHFMFQFLAGNLEFLGLRLDWALNLISGMALAAFLILLYQLAVLLTQRLWIGALTILLFFFRSSFAFFTFLAGLPGGQVFRRILTNQRYIGNTLHEDWGLWNLNVFVNQRHFAFSLGIMALVLILMIPPLLKMQSAVTAAKTAGMKQLWREWGGQRDAWLPQWIARPILAGVLLGCIAFWNGAVLIAALLILLGIALLAKHRLEFVITALIALTFAWLQSRLFIKSGGAALHPQLYWGFLAESPSPAGILSYYFELLGIFPIVIFFGLWQRPKTLQWLFIPFLCPLIMATCLSLTPDIAVNHKYVMIAVMFLNIIAANVIYRFFTSRAKPVWIARARQIGGVVIIGLLTVTGVVDMITLININRNTVDIRVADPFRVWVEKNTPPKAIFLTDTHSLDPILLAGRKIFYGWPYYAWSAGYNTAARARLVKNIYGAGSEGSLLRCVSANRIGYIMIDDGNRHSRDYLLNEKLIARTYRLVYRNPEGNTLVFRTNPIGRFRKSGSLKN